MGLSLRVVRHLCGGGQSLLVGSEDYLSGKAAGLREKSGSNCIIDFSVLFGKSLKKKASGRENKIYSV